MSTLFQLLVALHVSANLVWIGSLLALGVVLTTRVVEPRAAAGVALELYRRLANPAFVVSFVAGLSRLLASTHLYFVETRYMHGKLLFALGAIAAHHIIGARAKAVASGKRSSPGSMGGLIILFLVSALAAATLVVLRPF